MLDESLEAFRDTRLANGYPWPSPDAALAFAIVKARSGFVANGRASRASRCARDDAGFLKAPTNPGEHALVITVAAGKDNDLLE